MSPDLTKLHFNTFVYCVVIAWLVVSPALGNPLESRSEQVILLTSRQVLHGEVALYGDRYLITQPNSEIRIPRDRVQRICQNIEEAYLCLKHQTRFGSAGDHLYLAQWCLDEGLPSEAQKQLEEAIFKKPNHPRIELIRRQLDLISVGTGKEQSTAKTIYPPPNDRNVLESLSQSLPAGTVEMFTRTVQPLLLNGCGTRGCHGGKENQFTLYRTERGQQLPRRLTLRNLQSVLMWIDRKNTDESPLLHFASTPHFSMDHRSKPKLAFGPGSLPTKRLTQWLDGFSSRENTEKPVPFSASQGGAKMASVSPRSGDTLSLYNLSRPGANDPKANTSLPQIGRAKPADTFRPRDAFDAEIFNRRHHPQRPPAGD